MLSMSRRVVVFNAAPNTLTLYWAILTPKHYEVLTYRHHLSLLADHEHCLGACPALRLSNISRVCGASASKKQVRQFLQKPPSVLTFFVIFHLRKAGIPMSSNGRKMVRTSMTTRRSFEKSFASARKLGVRRPKRSASTPNTNARVQRSSAYGGRKPD
jgi:hypothetical protein